MAAPKMQRTYAVTVVLLSILFQLVLSTPVLNTPTVSQSKCLTRQYCSGETIEAFKPGHEYTYDYDIETLAEMRGSSENQSKLKIKTRAIVYVKSACDFALRFENVQVEGGNNNPTFAQTLTKHSVKFGLNDRTITDVCSHSSEPEWVLNIKKGFISSLQSTVAPSKLGLNVTETDVIGTCLTEYAPASSSLGSSDITYYRKTKFMETCQDNQKLYQLALNLPELNVQKMPLIKSEHTCDVAVSGDGKLESSVCQEVHLFRPLSSSSSGATTIVKQHVKLVDEKQSASNVPLLQNGKMSSLLFNRMTQDDLVIGEKHVLDLLQKYKSAPDSSRPDIFTDLVHSLRKFSHPQLNNLFYNQIKDNELQNLVLDALPLLKTDAGITLMKDLVDSKTLPGTILDIWFSTLPYYHNPTRSMLVTAASFLNGNDMEQPRKSALMGVAAMVNTFCRSYDNCQDLPEVQEIILAYESKLGSQCMASGQDEEDQIILSLKALKTIGHLIRAQDVLEKCYTEYSNSMYVRLAALDTIQKLSCGGSHSFYPKLFTTFSNTAFDSELRIGAYLALMSCPARSTVNVVKHVLTAEPVNQVGSFVWTHLTNIQESKSLSPYKKYLKTLVGSEFLQNKWKTDVRKFSRYFESSYYSDQLNIGATVDGQLVFSQESYIPRSAMVNLTANVFGENINLFEVGARGEQFEDLVENMFGPDGYFREDSFHKLLQNLRKKRNVDPGVISEFQSTFNNDLNDPTPRGNLYMKMFGRDLHYSSFNGLNDLMSNLASVWPMSLFGQGVFDNNQNLNYERSTIFLDGKIEIPTVAGLPLNLAVNGTSSVSLISKHNIDMANLFTTGTASATMEFIPKATIQITGTMSVDAKFAKAGLKSVSKLHTSTYFDGKINMDGWKLLEAEMNMPQDTIDVLDVSVDFFSLQNNDYAMIKSKNEPKKYNGCTPNALNNIFGMKMCGSVLYHENDQDNLDVYFAGPFALSMNLQKTDVFSKYTFQYTWNTDQTNPQHEHVTANFDTPGSQINRKTSLDLKYNRNSMQYLEVDMKMPVHDIGANVVYDWGPSKKLAKAAFFLKQQEVASFRYVLKNSGPNDFQSEAILTHSGTKIVHWKGDFTNTDMKKTLDCQLQGVFLTTPATLKGSLSQNDDRIELNGEIKSQVIDASLDGIFIQTDKSFNAKGDLTYETADGQENLSLTGNYELNNVGDMKNHTFSVQLESTDYPNVNSAVSGVIITSPNYVETKIKPLKIGQTTIVFEQLFSSQARSDYQELMFKLAFGLPAKNLEYLIDFEHRYGVNDIVNRLEVKWEDWIDFNAYLNNQREVQSQKIRAGLKYSLIDVKSTIDIITKDNEFNGKIDLEWGSNANQVFKSEFDLVRNSPTSYNVRTELAIPYLQPMSASGHLSYSQNSAKLDLNCLHGSSSYKANLRYTPINASGMRITGIVSNSVKTYNISMILRNDRIKSLQVDLQLEKRYSLTAAVGKKFSDVSLDLEWDSENYPENRLILKGKRLANEIELSLNYLNNQGKFNAKHGNNKVHIDLEYNGEKAKFVGEYLHDPIRNLYGLKGKMETTIPKLEKAAFEVEHLFEKVGDKTILSQKASVALNKISHKIQVKGVKEKDITFQLKTVSTNAFVDGLLINFDLTRQDKFTKAIFNGAYKQDQINMEAVYNSTKAKEGHFFLKTPWSYVQDLKTGFSLNLGKDLKWSTFTQLNNNDLASSTLTGIILPSNWMTEGISSAKFDAEVLIKNLEKMTAGIDLKKSVFEIESDGYLTYGTNKINLQGKYKPTPFSAKLAFEAKTKVFNGKSQLSFSKGQDTLDINAKFDKDSVHVLDFGWNSRVSSLWEHIINFKTQFYNNEATFVANNNNGLDAKYEFKVVKNGQEFSKAQFTLKNIHDDQNGSKVLEIESSITGLLDGNVSYKQSLKSSAWKNNLLISYTWPRNSPAKKLEFNHQTTIENASALTKKIKTNLELKVPTNVYISDASSISEINFEYGKSAAGEITLVMDGKTFKFSVGHKRAVDGNGYFTHDGSVKVEGPFGKCGLTGNLKYARSGFDVKLAFDDIHGKKSTGKLTGKIPSEDYFGFKIPQIELLLESPAYFEKIYLEADLFQPIINNDWDWCSKHTFKMTVAGLEIGATVELKLKDQIESKLELESQLTIAGHDGQLKMTGYLDKANQVMNSSMILTKDSANLVKWTSEAIWNMEEKEIYLDLEWYDKKIFDVKTVLKNDEKSASMIIELKYPGKNLLLTGSVDKVNMEWQLHLKMDDKNFVKMKGSCNWEKKYYLNGPMNKMNKVWELELRMDQKFVKINGKFEWDSYESKFFLEHHMENNLLNSFKKFDFKGLFDGSNSEDVKFELEGKSDNNANSLAIVSNFKTTQGSILFTVELPVVKIPKTEVSLEYEIKNLQGKVMFKNSYNKQEIDLKWVYQGSKLVGDLIAKTNSVTKTVKFNKDMKDGILYFDLSLDGQEMISLESGLNPSLKTLILKMKTAYKLLEKVELIYDIQSMTKFNVIASYNDVFDARLVGEVTKDTKAWTPSIVSLNYTIKFEIPKLDQTFFATVGYDVSSVHEKILDVSLIVNDQKAFVKGQLNKQQALLEIESWFTPTKKTVEFSWKPTIISLVAKNGESEIHRSELVYSYDQAKPYVGQVTFTTTVPILDVPFRMFSKFNIGGQKKEVTLSIKASDHEATMSTIYEMTEDTFDGKLNWKSNVQGYENAILDIEYNIASEPTAFISLDRNGKKDFIRTKLSFQPITIEITTSFKSYEKLIFTGNYSHSAKIIQLALTLSRNDQPIVVFDNNVKKSKDLMDFELISNILTPIQNWKSLTLEFGWKLRKDPYAIKLKIIKEQNQYDLKGHLKVYEGEFSLSANTPFPGYESISLAGKFGTTSLGKQLGVSFEQNKIRRDLSVSYEQNDNVAMYHLKTPLKQYESIKLRTMMMSDMGSQMDFAFETQGEQNDMAIGIMYDFSKGFSNGMLLMKVKAAPLNRGLSNLEGKIEYKDVDGILSNGFSGMFYFSKDDNVVASGKITRVPGHTKVAIKTPIRGFTSLKMEMKSDYASNFFMSLEKNADMYSLNVDKVGTYDFDVLIKTPISNYQTLKATFRQSGTVGTLEIFRNAKRISKLVVDAEVKGRFWEDNMSGKLKVDWEATPLMAKMHLIFDSETCSLHLTSNSHDWKFTIESRKNGAKEIFKFLAVMDQDRFSYEAERTWKTGQIIGSSKFSTTLDYFGAKDQTTSYDLKYPDISKMYRFTQPLTLDYETKRSGKTVFETKIKFDLDIESKFVFEGFLRIPDSLPEDLNILLSVIKTSNSVNITGKFNKNYVLTSRASWTLSGPKDLFKSETTITVPRGPFNFNFQIEVTDSEAAFKVDGNLLSLIFARIPDIKTEGKITWQAAGRNYEVKCMLKNQGQELVSGVLRFDMSPFSKFKILVKGKDFGRQEINLNLTPNQKPYLKIVTKGDWSEGVFEGNFKHTNKMTEMGYTTKGNLIKGMTFEAAEVYRVIHNCDDGHYGYRHEWKADSIVIHGVHGVKTEGFADLELIIKSVYDFQFNGEAKVNPSPYGDGPIDKKITLAYFYDRQSGDLTFKAIIPSVYNLNGELKKQKINIVSQTLFQPPPHMSTEMLNWKFVGENDGFKKMDYELHIEGKQWKIKFHGETEGYSKFKYSLGLNDVMLVEFESVNDVSMNNVDSVTKLKFKMGSLYTLTADFKAEINNDMKFTAILSLKKDADEDSFLVKYSHKNAYMPNFEFELQVVPSTKGLWIPGSPYDILVKYWLKEGGRVLGIENLSKKAPNTNGKFRISLYENLSTNGDDGNGKNYDIVFKQDIYGDYQLFINVDKAAKTAKLEFSSGVTTLADFNARVIMDSNNYGLKFKATFPETSSAVIDLNVDIKYPLTWSVKLTFENVNPKLNFHFDLKLDMKQDSKTQGVFATNFKTDHGVLVANFKTERHDIKVKLELKNKPNLKLAVFNAEANGKKFILETKSQPGQFDFKITSDVNRLKNIEFLVKYEPTRVDVEFKWGPVQPKQSIRLEYENTDQEFELEMEIGDDQHMSIEFDKAANSLRFDGKIAGKEMKIEATYSSGNTIKITATEPFTQSGKINFEGKWQRISNGGKVLAKGDFNAINYQLTMEATTKGLKIDIKRGSDKWIFDSNYSANANAGKLHVEITGPGRQHIFYLESSYTRSATKFSGSIKGILPPYLEGHETDNLIQIDVEHDLPNKLSLNAKAVLGGNTMLEINSGASVTGDFKDMKITFTLFSPPLGLTKKDLGVEIVYKTISAEDFEYKIAVTTLRKVYKAGIKLNLKPKAFETKVLAGYDTWEHEITLGGSMDHQYGVLIIKGHLNNINLDLKVSRDHVKIDFNAKLKLENGKRDDLFYWFINRFYPFKDGFSVEFEYFEYNSVRLQVQVDGGVHEQYVIAFTVDENTNLLSGTLTLKSRALGFHRTSEVTIQYGKAGRVEITVGGNQRHSMRLQMHEGNGRIARAIFNSPSFGQYDFRMDQDIKKGIIVLTTTHGIHKLSYKLEDEDPKMVMEVNFESPLLSNGHAKFQTTINKDDHVYGGQIAFNNEHFLSWSLRLLSDEFYTSVALESTLLPSKFNGVIKMNNGVTETSAIISVSLGNELHKVETSFNKQHFGGKLSVVSPKLWAKEWNFKSELNKPVNGEYVFKIEGNMGEIWTAQVLGKMTWKQPFEIVASLNYDGTIAGISKAKLDLKTSMQTNFLFDFDLTTSHPSLPHFKVIFKEEPIGSQRVFKFVIEDSKQAMIEATLKIPKPSDNLVSNKAELIVSTLYGQYNLNSEWKDIDTEVKNIKLTIQTPKVEKIILTLKTTLNNLFIDMESNVGIALLPKAASIQFTKSPDYSLQHGKMDVILKIDDDKNELFVEHAFEANRRYVSGEMTLPTFHEGALNQYEFRVGYEDTQRKSIKARVVYPYQGQQQESGALFDYHVNSALDFKIEAEIDLPIPELKITAFKLGHRLTQDSYTLSLGGEWMNHDLDLEAKLKCDTVSTLVDVKSKFNDYQMVTNTIIDQNQFTIDSSMTLELPTYGTIKVLVVKKDDITAMVEYNDVKHFYLQKNRDSKTVTIELQDIFAPSAVKASLTLDSGVDRFAKLLTIETIWDTLNKDTTTEIFTIGFQRNGPAYAYNSQFTWSNKDVDSLTGNFEQVQGKLLTAVSVLHNDEKRFGFDMAMVSEISSGEWDTSEHVAFVIPSHSMDYSWHMRRTHDAISYGGNLAWAKAGQPLKGFGYAYDVHQKSDNTLSKTLVLKKIGPTLSQSSFSIKYDTNMDVLKKSLLISSPGFSNGVRFEVLLDASECDEETSKLKFKLHQGGIVPWRSDITKHEVTATLQWLTNEMEIIYRNNQDLFRTNAIVFHDSETTGIKMNLYKNEHDFGYLIAQAKNDKPQATVEMGIDDKKMDIFVGLKQVNLVSFSISRKVSRMSDPVDDIMATVELSPDGRVLKTEFDWRPELSEEISEKLVEGKNMLSRSHFFESIRSDFGHFESTLRHMAHETSLEVLDVLDVDFGAYTQIVKEWKENMGTLYLYKIAVVRKIINYSTDVIVKAVDETSKLMNHLVKYGKISALVVKDLGEMAYKFFNHYFAHVSKVVVQWQKTTLNHMFNVDISDINLNDQIKVAIHLLGDSLQWISEKYRELREHVIDIPSALGGEFDRDINEFMTELAKQVKRIKAFNDILNFYMDYQSWFEEFHLTEYIEEATGDLKYYFHKIHSELQKIKEAIVNYWNKTVGLINKTISDYPLLAYGASVGRKMYRFGKTMSEQYTMESSFRQLIRRFIGRVDSLASTLVRAIDVVYHKKSLMSYEYTYDLQDGQVSYVQVLPFQWYRFDDTPDIVKVFEFLGLNAGNQEAVEPFNWEAFHHDLLDVIDTLNKAIRAKSVIPPFSATALLAGDSHIITFDQKYYDFAGSQGCSYLLASDFSNGKFSAIANYDQDMSRTSIDIVSDGHTINVDTKMFEDGLIKVTLDKRNAQLPILFDHTYVYRRENSVIIENSEGLKVTCNAVFNVCTFTISGWYFGKTGGLLGIYDNEPSNDWMNPEREVISSLEDFVKSWTMDKGKNCPIKFADQMIPSTSVELDTCAEIFKMDNSPLKPCFSTINPEPFNDMCLKDMELVKNRPDKRTGVCPASSAYIEQCRTAGVEIWIPGQCVQCKQQNNNVMKNGESTRYQGNAPESSVDIVFIVQQSQCLAETKLKDLPYMIERSLKDKGQDSLRFALVGFGGQDQLAKPHVFTSGSQIFNDVSKMTPSLDNLKKDGQEGANVFEALQFAARLRFRPGVRKTFVLVMCEDVTNSLNSKAYGDSMTMLSEQDITLHLAAPVKVGFKGLAKSRMNSKIFGFTKDNVLTASGMDSSLRPQIQDPKTHLTTLTQESGGLVFDLGRLSIKKKATLKKASTAMSKALSNLSQPVQCQVCDCIANPDGQGQLMCHKCILPTIDIVLQNWEKYGAPLLENQ